MFAAHAPADAQFAAELGAFLETGCDDVCFAEDATIKPGQDLISAAERGLSADILILLLSSASNPSRWVRETWEPLLFSRAAETNTRVAIVLLEQCVFPILLRRGLKVFDATAARLPAMRQLKRWTLGIRSGTFPAEVVSADLETLYVRLADQPGTLTTSGTIAERFAREAARDFEAVFWIPAHGRTLAQIAGELGSQLQMKLDGPVAENCRRLSAMLSPKRCLVILDAPDVAVDPVMPAGRTSVLLTSEPVRILDDSPSLPLARGLVSASRLAEAHEMLYQLLDAGVAPESCARELAWICEHWGRTDEANSLRFHFGPSPSEQLRLFAGV